MPSGGTIAATCSEAISRSNPMFGMSDGDSRGRERSNIRNGGSRRPAAAAARSSDWFEQHVMRVLRMSTSVR
jgi:hypothetical protein